MKSFPSLFLLLLFLSSSSLANEKAFDMEAKVKSFFNQLNKNNLELCRSFYSKNLTFQDPLGEIKGIEKMIGYYKIMYENVTSIRFQFKEMIIQENRVFAPWTMTLATSKLNSGKEFDVEGGSLIEFDPQTQLAFYHRDYFDMGSLLYEKIPILKSVIGMIKGRFHKKEK